MRWNSLIIAAMAGFFLADGDEATRNDIQRMQGTWLVVKQVADGREATDKELKEADIRLVVKDTGYTVVYGGKKLTEGKLKVVASKLPAELDATDSDGPLKGQARPALYKFDGKLWVVNFAKAGQPRPTDFTCVKGSNRLTLTYQLQGPPELSSPISPTSGKRTF